MVEHITLTEYSRGTGVKNWLLGGNINVINTAKEEKGLHIKDTPKLTFLSLFSIKKNPFVSFKFI